MSNETGSGEASSSGFVDVEPSLPLCIALSAFGGFLEVSSTMCLAYPEYKAKLGKVYTKCEQRLHMGLNLSLMAIASVAYIVGSFYGPVALSVPTVMVSKLLFNLVIIGFVLRMDTFSKNQKVGTYCIACAILTLPSIGPKDQAGLVPSEIILELPAIIWSATLFACAIACCLGMVVLKRRAVRPPEWVSMAVYVTAQVTSAVIGTSVSKMFAKSEGVFLYTLFALAIVFAAINVVSLIFAATTVDQGALQPQHEPHLALARPTTPLTLARPNRPHLTRPNSPSPGGPGRLRADADVHDTHHEHGHRTDHLAGPQHARRQPLRVRDHAPHHAPRHLAARA